MMLLLIQSSFVQWFLERPGAPGAQSAGTNWIIRSIVVAAIVAGLMFVVKGFRKKTTAIAAKKAWTRGQSWLFIVAGLAPVLLILWLNFYFSSIFTQIIGTSGLFSGILLAWLSYLLIMFLGHLVSPWRREVI